MVMMMTLLLISSHLVTSSCDLLLTDRFKPLWSLLVNTRIWIVAVKICIHDIHVCSTMTSHERHVVSITGRSVVCLTVGLDQYIRIHQSSAQLAFCKGHLPVTVAFPVQRAGITEIASMLWRHHMHEYSLPKIWYWHTGGRLQPACKQTDHLVHKP